jgi:hypothetical protein
LLEVSRAAYYEQRKNAPSTREQADAELTKEITRIHGESKGRYGAPRIHAELRRKGIRHGKKRVARLMRSAGLRGRSPMRWTKTTIPDPAAAYGRRGRTHRRATPQGEPPAGAAVLRSLAMLFGVAALADDNDQDRPLCQLLLGILVLIVPVGLQFTHRWHQPACLAILYTRTRAEAPTWIQRLRDALITNAIVSAVFLVLGILIGKAV